MDGDREIAGRLPVVAVLPFAAGDVESDTLLATGLHEDVCAELTRFRSLRVISPESAAVVANLPDSEIGRRLGASHLLRARLRSVGTSLQLAANLSGTSDFTQIWSERFDIPTDELFELKDRVVARIAATLNARIENATLVTARRKPTANLVAHELTLRGLAQLRLGTLEADEAARVLFNRALELDPHYPRAYSGLALSHFNEWSCLFWDRFEVNAEAAYRHAHSALDLDDLDALPHVIIGRVLLYRRQFDNAAWYFDRALLLCPHDPQILMEMVNADIFLGRAQRAVAHVELAMRLNPYHPNDYYALSVYAHLFARQFDKTIESAKRLHVMPIIDIPACIAIACAHLGRITEGRTHLAEYYRLFGERILFGATPEPGDPLRWFIDVNPFKREEDIALIREGFELLGESIVFSEPTIKTARQDAVFTRAGSGWIAVYDGQKAVLPELKGLCDIRRLLERPGEAIHCLDLAERESATGSDVILDERARNELKTRILELQEDLVEAEDDNDIGRAEQLRDEMDRLLEALSNALGFGGRNRRLGDTAEKARTAVTWRIRHALRRIQSAHPALGRHLDNSLRTGTFCQYRTETPVLWRFHGG